MIRRTQAYNGQRRVAGLLRRRTLRSEDDEPECAERDEIPGLHLHSFNSTWGSGPTVSERAALMAVSASRHRAA